MGRYSVLSLCRGLCPPSHTIFRGAELRPGLGLDPPSPLWGAPAAWGRAESKLDAARKGRGPGRARGGAPVRTGKETPALGAAPTHLAREVVARTAGRGAQGSLAISGGSDAGRARHVPRRERGGWAGERGTARDGAEPPRPRLHPLLPPGPPPAGTPAGSSLHPATAPTAPAHSDVSRRGARERGVCTRGAARPSEQHWPTSHSQGTAQIQLQEPSPEGASRGLSVPAGLASGPGDPTCCFRSGLRRAPGFPLPLRSAAGRWRPSSGRVAGHR